ncbi:acyl-CoA dehydrogenase family protein [Trebonia sp.]|uniref:acyl-CoA dehydrogenase family protein n=1 Tax=Trebonia sp. TaxID=2767075 RepID=UPI0026107176|nr:acyl-CoA dehydrogenase family protein [Trebonia sp.]
MSDFTDFYGIEQLLTGAGRDAVQRTRDFMAKEVEPVINRLWTREEFPFELIPGIAALGITGVAYEGYGCPGGGPLLDGVLAMEIARSDPSMSTFMGVHSGLAMGSVYLCGSPEQKERWLPPMARLEKIGAFGLTEPDVGSGVAGGLTTTARREGDEWVIDGQKKWIGNATFADYIIIWARDVGDGQVKGFVVEKGTPGLSTTKIKDKIALRVVQNAYITLDGVRVPEANRLQQATSFRQTAAVLRLTRAGVAWQAVGCSMGAYEHALAYAKEREQFGRPIAGFQLVQDLLVRMLANITASACMCARLAQLQAAGEARDEHSALAKAFCTVRMRETVGYARELLGGNGILLEHQVGRFVADAEAIYSYEGTREINTLVVGRAITGLSAFV